MFQGKVVLITDETDSLDQTLRRSLLQIGVKTIQIFSRNQNKQMLKEKI